MAAATVHTPEAWAARAQHLCDQASLKYTGRLIAERNGVEYFTVPSRDRTAQHVVEHDTHTDRIRCDCVAGSYGRQCAHAGCVLYYLAQRAAAYRQAQPTPAERVAAEGGYEITSSELVPLGEAGQWAVRVTALVRGRRYVGTSEVQRDAPHGADDHRTPIERAENAALDRALGFAGLGITSSTTAADATPEPEASTPAPGSPAPVAATAPSQPKAPAPAQPATAADDGTPATEAQLRAIGRMCTALGREAPKGQLTAAQARAIIVQLTNATRQAKSEQGAPAAATA